MSARFLDDEARAAFAKAVTAIEEVSAAEIVVAVRRRSERYLHANLIVGALAAFAALAGMLFVSVEFSLPAILIDTFATGLLAGLLVEWLPDVKRVLTPRRMRRPHVLRAARATFVERGVHNTRDRSGLLVYISWLELTVALVADSGLETELTPELLATAEASLTHEMRRGGAAVAHALESLASDLAAAMPRREDDVNELPDALDSDLHPPPKPAAPDGEGAPA